MVARRAGLSGFWRSVLKRYGRAVLDQSQIEWIIKAKKEGKRNADIATAQGVSVRRVRQFYSQYRKTGTVPVLKRPGRRRAPAITENERALIKDAHQKFRLCACYLEAVLDPSRVRAPQGIHSGRELTQ